jgi:hypothetical protein
MLRLAGQIGRITVTNLQTESTSRLRSRRLYPSLFTADSMLSTTPKLRSGAYPRSRFGSRGTEVTLQLPDQDSRPLLAHGLISSRFESPDFVSLLCLSSNSGTEQILYLQMLGVSAHMMPKQTHEP